MGFDIQDCFGVADVVSGGFLPSAEDSFDVVLSTQASYYVAELSESGEEIRRCLRARAEPRSGSSRDQRSSRQS